MKNGTGQTKESPPTTPTSPGRIHLFSSKAYDRDFFTAANKELHFEIRHYDYHLSAEILAATFSAGDVVCAFVNDPCNRGALEAMKNRGCTSLVLRSAGYNHVDLAAAKEFRIRVARVPAYSPYAVAEHTVALTLALNRRIHRAYNRVREGNFNLEGLLGFDLHKKTVGIIGTGKIGYCAAKIFRGFGCEVLAVDLIENENLKKLGVRYTVLEDLLRSSDVVSLHCPLNDKTRHMIDKKRLDLFKKGAMLINTSRGALIDTPAVVNALKSGRLGYLGIDVYEEEAELFFDDQSEKIIQDDVFTRLMTFPNVLITGHQAFFTVEALRNIAEVTLCNARDLVRGDACANEVML